MPQTMTVRDLPEAVLEQRRVSEEQLLRIRVLATLAWGDETPFRYGYDITYNGVTIYVRQTRGERNKLERTCDTASAACAAMHDVLIDWAARTTKRPKEAIQAAVDKAIAAVSSEVR